MTDGLTFGVRLEANSNVAEVAKGDSSELERLKAATDALAASSGKMASQYAGLDAAVKQHSAAVAETAGNVNKLLDRYDPLGAKLRQLQADFKALDAAAAGGKIAGRDDARVDLVYQKIQQEIGAATSAAQSFGNVAAGKSDEVAWATARARQEFMVLGREIASGNYSRIPSTLSIIAQGLSPVALGVAAVTAAVAAGAYAWSEWGDAAGAAADKALGSLYEAQEEARKSKHLTDSDRREQLREQIATNQAQIKELDLEIARKIAIEQQPMGSRRTAGERESIEVGIAALRNSQDAHRATIENLKKSEQELTEKITPSSIAIAKQTSELWKNYEIKEKLAKLTGGAKPDAPSDAAIIADAAGGLRDKLNKDAAKAQEKILADAKRFDEASLESHEDALTKWVLSWKKTEDLLTSLGASGVAQRKQHEAAYITYVNAENEKLRKKEADKAAADTKKYSEDERRQREHLARQLVSENAYFAHVAVAANNADKTAAARENKRYQNERIELQRRREMAEEDYDLSLYEEEQFRMAEENIDRAHRQRQMAEGRAAAENQLAVAGTQFRVMFELNKVYRTADAVIEGVAAVQSAYKFGSSWGGPMGGAAMAAIAAAATAANVMAIQGAQFGGGTGAGGAGGGPGGAAIATRSPLAPVSPAERPLPAAAPAPAPQQFNLTVVGAKSNPDAPLLSYNAVVNDLLPLIEKAGKNGHRVKFNVVAA